MEWNASRFFLPGPSRRFKTYPCHSEFDNFPIWRKFGIQIEKSGCNMSRHPEVKWAQCSDKLFITIELPDAINPKVKVQPNGKFTFSARAGKDQSLYEFDLDLLDKVNVQESKISVGLRNILCALQKEEKKWWKQLVKTEGKRLPFLKVDWNKWVDEDEENDKFGGDMDFGGMGMDFSKLGMSDDDESFEDDEEIGNGNEPTKSETGQQSGIEEDVDKEYAEEKVTEV